MYKLNNLFFQIKETKAVNPFQIKETISLSNVEELLSYKIYKIVPL